MLGPLLYSVYVNKMRVYLKDTYIANSICEIRRWFNSKSSYYSQKIRDVYKFKFAVCECKEKFWLTFCRVGDSFDVSSKVLLGEKPILQVKSLRYLGFHIDSNLSWKHHSDIISTKIARGVGILKRSKHILPECTLHDIFCYNLPIYHTNV